MDGKVGLESVPADGDIKQLIERLHANHSRQLLENVNELFETLKQTNEAQEPRIFAYGKLLNYLASDDITQPELISIAAAAMWQIVTQ